MSLTELTPKKSPMNDLPYSFCAAGSKVLQYSKLKQWRSLDPYAILGRELPR